MTNFFDFPKLVRGTVGFDDMFTKIMDLGSTPMSSVFPPYNIKKTGENTYVIELAVAGFGKQNIELTLEDGVLTIKGQIVSDVDEEGFLYKGIADRAFTRKFTLADTVEVKNADMLNGMLKIWLERIIPDHKKPRKIDINGEDETAITKKKGKKEELAHHQV